MINIMPILTIPNCIEQVVEREENFAQNFNEKIKKCNM